MAEQHKETATRNIGIAVAQPLTSCSDNKCPFHGSLNVKQHTFVGTVVSSKAQRSATIQWERRLYIPKYERYLKKRARLHVHNPACLDAKEGDLVRVIETRPLSKTKNFVIIQKLGEVKIVTGIDTPQQERKKKEKEIESEAKDSKKKKKTE